MFYVINQNFTFVIYQDCFIKKVGSGGLMFKVYASQPLVRGFKPLTGHGHDSSYDTSTGWFKEADLRVIYISCESLLHNRAKVN